MIDYKLVLILILSIVLLFYYNKTEALRNEVVKLKKRNMQVDEEEKKVKTSEELLNLFQEKNIIIHEETENDLNLNKCPFTANSNKNINCDFPIISQSLTKPLNVEKDNTSSYNATESSEEIDINYEEETTSKHEEFVIYSNEKEINVQEALDNIQKNNNKIIINEQNILLTTTLLTKSYEGDIDIINDSSNSDEKNINIQELETLTDISKEVSEEKIMKEFNNIEIINENGFIHLQKVNNKSPKNEENEGNEENKENINNKDYIEIDIDKSQFKEINLNSINKYKLNDLQDLAKTFNINITKLKNGKEINKTKKELYNEINLNKNN